MKGYVFYRYWRVLYICQQTIDGIDIVFTEIYFFRFCASDNSKLLFICQITFTDIFYHVISALGSHGKSPFTDDLFKAFFIAEFTVPYFHRHGFLFYIGYDNIVKEIIAFRIGIVVFKP